jgi:hypothetical protein
MLTSMCAPVQVDRRDSADVTTAAATVGHCSHKTKPQQQQQQQ